MRLVEASAKSQARLARDLADSLLDAWSPTELFYILPAIERVLLTPVRNG
jgi:hypothetical protein